MKSNNTIVFEEKCKAISNILSDCEDELTILILEHLIAEKLGIRIGILASDEQKYVEEEEEYILGIK